jgi:hypothetical protein
MIAGFQNLESANDGTTRTVSVFALEDASGATETLKFQILGQPQTRTVVFAPNEGKTVTVTHTETGKGLVTVTATGSSQTSRRILDVGKQPGDVGTAA